MNIIELSFHLAKSGISEDIVKILQPQFPTMQEIKQHWSSVELLPLPSSGVMENVIRQTLGLNAKDSISKIDVMAAVLSAALTPLRQTLGSCFATAPAIFVQRYRLDLFFEDFHALLKAGRLTRVVDGQEMIAPLCPSLRPGSSEHPLLKSWEYTLASFSDYQVGFFKWNLIMCLGLDPQEEGGLGKVIYDQLDERLQKQNGIVQELQQDVETAAYFYQSDPGNEGKRHQYELRAHARDVAHQQAEKYAGFFKWIIDHYRDLFDEFFQELYDPQMVSQEGSLYNDRPAGFRLVYKHGRADPLMWTQIYDQQQYLLVLRDFFHMCEGRLVAECDWKDGKKTITEITTHILHVLDEAFMPKAFARANALHEKTQTGAVHVTPWSYLSGGSMDGLLKCYFRIDGDLERQEKKIESPMDLLVFYLESLKNAPPQRIQSSLFTYSPTHAFSLMTTLPEFEKAWQSKVFTYTWVRDNMVNGPREKLEEILLSTREQADLIQQGGLHANPSTHALKIQDFRNELVAKWGVNPEDIDRILVKHWKIKPLFFADTNWLGMFFAFAYNPGLGILDLWRSDLAFKNPKPMHIWREHLNGKSGGCWGIIFHRFMKI